MYKITLALRYMFKRPVSYLALAAIALCVFTVVVVMTVMTGLVGDFKAKNHDFAGDCVVGTDSLVGFAYYEEFVRILQRQEFIEAVSPAVKSYALINAVGSERNYGLEMIGIDPVKHSITTGFGRTLHHRRDDIIKAFAPVYEPNLPGFVIGIDRWLQRDAKGRYTHQAAPARIGLGVSCFPLTSKGALARAGTDLVNTKTFYYSDTSHSGLARVDSSVIYLPLEWAQQLCGMAGPFKRVNAIHIKFRPNVGLTQGCRRVDTLWQEFKEEKQGEKYADLLNTVTVQGWKDFRRQYIAAMETEQVMLIIMFSLVAVTTVFIVFVVFYMIVSHKRKDIGILKSIGASNCDVMQLFAFFAFLVGLVGSALGSLAGWVFLLKINTIENLLFERFGFQLWDRTIYAIGQIPNRLEFNVLAVIIISAIAACLAGAYLPARQAACCEPVEALQVNQL